MEKDIRRKAMQFMYDKKLHKVYTDHLPQLFVTGSWKICLLGCIRELSENSIKKIIVLFSNKVPFLQIWIKQLLKILAMKFHTKSFFFLEEMNDFIRPNQCIQKVGFPTFYTSATQAAVLCPPMQPLLILQAIL